MHSPWACTKCAVIRQPENEYIEDQQEANPYLGLSNHARGGLCERLIRQRPVRYSSALCHATLIAADAPPERLHSLPSYPALRHLSPFPSVTAMAQSSAVDVPTFLGPMMIGGALSGVVFGCAVVQTHTYARQFPNDTPYIKGVIGFEMSLQTIHLALLLAGLWRMAVIDFGNPVALARFPAPMVITMIMCSPLVCTTQLFFTFRLWRLTSRHVLCATCLMLALTRFGLNIAFGGAAYRLRDVTQVVHDWWWCISSVFATSIACDTLIAVALIEGLNKRKTGFNRTSWLIDKLIAYAVATGLTTTACELAQALCFWTMPDNYIWLGFYAVESGLYTNSILATLNSRTMLNEPPEPRPSQKFSQETGGRVSAYVGGRDQPYKYEQTTMIATTLETEHLHPQESYIEV